MPPDHHLHFGAERRIFQDLARAFLTECIAEQTEKNQPKPQLVSSPN